MRGKRLPGVDNTTLRRRIVRAENDIIPRVLRGVDSRGSAHAIHAIETPFHWAQPASESQTAVGAQLSIPPDHPAACWLSTSWTVPDLTSPPPGVPGQWAPTLPSPDAGDHAARWRGHAMHGATPARQPPLNMEATTAAGPRRGSRRSFASMDERQPAREYPTDRPLTPHELLCTQNNVAKRSKSNGMLSGTTSLAIGNVDPNADGQEFAVRRTEHRDWPTKQGCPDLPAPPHPPFAQRHTVYRTNQTPTNECLQFDADPDAVHTSVARAKTPSTDFKCFAFAPSEWEDSFARAASISTDFTRVTSAEDRAFARLLSISAKDTHPGFLVGGEGAKAYPCNSSRASQAGGEGLGGARHSFARATSGCPDLARLFPEEAEEDAEADELAPDHCGPQGKCVVFG